jgi:hypothetical protein
MLSPSSLVAPVPQVVPLTVGGGCPPLVTASLPAFLQRHPAQLRRVEEDVHDGFHLGVLRRLTVGLGEPLRDLSAQS